MVQVIRSLLWDLRSLLKTHIFWKKAIFSAKKCICPIFFRFVECDKPQETIYRIRKDVLTISVEVKRSFFRTWEVVESTTFWKKNGYCSNGKVFTPTICRIIDFNKPQGKTSKGPQGILKPTVEVIRSLLWDLSGC